MAVVLALVLWLPASASPMGRLRTPPQRLQHIYASPCEKSVSRRTSLGIIGIVAPIVTSLATSGNAKAATPQIISDAASKLPGYGMPDLFFPSYFEGKWDCISELIDIQFPSGEEMVPNINEVKTLRKYIGTPSVLLRFNQSFIPFRGHVIADRGINTRAAREAARFDDQTKEWYLEKSEIRNVEWDPANPNVLAYMMRKGEKVDVLVTKRAFENPSPEVFITSEVVRQTQTELAELGVTPVTKQVKDQVKYRRVAPDEIRAIMISNVYLAPGDGVKLEDVIKAGNKPITTYRTRIIMTKVP
mmetsp:Transcript_18045/g.27062  ORF Transcript_18045/g.27062 Transcript_18045/m.27062 type:complete len:302 (+) Transcript_18045:20-925(+)